LSVIGFREHVEEDGERDNTNQRGVENNQEADEGVDEDVLRKNSPEIYPQSPSRGRR